MSCNTVVVFEQYFLYPCSRLNGGEEVEESEDTIDSQDPAEAAVGGKKGKKGRRKKDDDWSAHFISNGSKPIKKIKSG